MMCRGALALLLIGLPGCSDGASDAANVNGRTSPQDSVAPSTERAGERPTVLFVGTSLTAGLGLDAEHAYPALIEEKIDSAGLPYAVTNAGVSGETSSGLLRRLDWLLESDFDVVVIETGANDGLRGIPVETARENIDRILTRVRSARPEAAIVLAQMEAPPNLGAGYTAPFREMYPRLARKHGATLMPFLLEGVAGEAELNQGDGIHPDEAGARRVAENVWATVGEVLESRAATRGRGAAEAAGER